MKSKSLSSFLKSISLNVLKTLETVGKTRGKTEEGNVSSPEVQTRREQEAVPRSGIARWRLLVNEQKQGRI